MIPQAEGQRHRVGVADDRLDAQNAMTQTDRQFDLVIGGPGGIWRVLRSAPDSRDPGAFDGGAAVGDAPRRAAGEAVDGVLLRRVAEGQLIVATIPDEAPVADAV